MTEQRTGFFDAKTARNIAIGGAAKSTTVLDEIHTLEDQVLADANLGHLEIETAGEPGLITAFTSTAAVFNAWNDPFTYTDSEHRIARAQMNEIINYFTRLGYSVKRERDGAQNRFKWLIKW